MEFLTKQAVRLNLKISVSYPAAPTKPVVVLTWLGSEPTLPSILLNSHMDVVPVFAENWNYPPFGAVIDNGCIYARGSQDMKSVGMQYLSAIHALQIDGYHPKRTVNICYVPGLHYKISTTTCQIFYCYV